MKWSLLVGRLWDTEIRLHASLLLLIPYAVIVFQPRDVGGALRVLLLLAAVFACVALHEIGHTAAARAFGIQVTSIVLWPLGGLANLSRRPESALQDAVISAAGPLTNFLLGVLLAVLTVAERMLQNASFPEAGLLAGFTRALGSINAFPFLLSLTVANFTLALFNLIPVYPLDGGQIARGVLKQLFGERRADLILLLISLPAALGLVALGVAIGDVLVVITGVLMAFSGLTLNLTLLNGLALAGLYFFDRGAYHLRQSDYDAAVAYFTKGIEDRSDRPGLYVARAAAYLNLLDFDRAAADAGRALALEANQPAAWALRGEALALLEKPEAAMRCYDRAIALRPQWSAVYVDRGELHQNNGDLLQALRDMNQAVELGRSSPTPYLMRSILRYRMGDRAGASEDAEQALRFAPQWMLTFPEVFLIHLRGNLDWSLAYYALAVRRLPRSYQAYQGRADVCRLNERMEWALADYHRAIQLAPGQAELYLNRGKVYLALGEAGYAAGDFVQAQRLAQKGHLRRQAAALFLQAQALLSQAGPPPEQAHPVEPTRA
jgi:Zn-dependent protease/Tfp pilus assembly protein PilF